MASKNNLTHIDARAVAVASQSVEAKAKSPNRHTSALSPEMRKRLTEECRVRGCVQTAKIYGVTVGACLELRIADLERVVREAREWIALMQRKEAA